MLDQPDPTIWLVTGSHQLRSYLQRPADWQLTLFPCAADAFIPAVDGGQTYTTPLVGHPATATRLIDQAGELQDGPTGTLDHRLADDDTMPMGLFRPSGDGHYQLYLHVGVYAGRVRFLKLPAAPLTLAEAGPALIAAIDEHYLKVNNFLCFRLNLRPEIELEHKFTITSDPDVYQLARALVREVSTGQLPGVVLEIREELQHWDFLNHLYSITAPEDQVGYVSFIPTTDGCYTVKRKQFAADTDERPEQRRSGTEIPSGDLAGYVRDELGLASDWNASFRRIRYDVFVEMIESGNGYGIAFDRCTVTDEQGNRIDGLPELLQCEIEYVYSVALDGTELDSVRADLARLVELISDYLDRHGVTSYQQHESKLTFLRNLHVPAR